MLKRRLSRQVHIDHVLVGGDAPIMVQSMTNTDTADIAGTVAQLFALAGAGSEVVRITVNSPEAAAAVAAIRAGLDALHCNVPLVGDFHFNGHKLLRDYPECAKALAKYRINPGNVGRGDKHDTQFTQMIEIAIRENKPVRIGVNWGSLDQDVMARMMNENASLATPLSAQQVMRNALVTSALESAALAESVGLAADKIILSCKVSDVQDLRSRLRRPCRALRLSAAPRAHRSGNGQQGDRCIHSRHVHIVATRHRRHRPRVAHARARWRPN